MTVTYTIQSDTKFQQDIEIPLTVRKDLQKLADYLWNLPDDYKHFDMHYLWQEANKVDATLGTRLRYFHDTIRPVDMSCGSVACALGHAIDAGIDCDDFRNYQQLKEYLICGEPGIYTWLFSSDWTEADNTAKGAAIRIQILLDHGLPIDACEQVSDTGTLIYTR